MVQRIAEKYQIGSHTMTHQLVWQQSKAELRAPGFSIRESEGWAYEILNELGIKYDCSVFPATHAHGGLPSYPKAAPGIIDYKGIQMKEFPVSFKTIAGKHIIYSGGGYFRLFPYSLIKMWSKQSPNYLMAYIHPRDLDAGQPMLEGLPATRKFKSYVGLKGAESKLRKYLSEFEFTDIATASEGIDWGKAPRVRLG